MTQTKANILYVEDDVYLSYVTIDNLKLKGYNITYCENGKKAIEAFNNNKFDLCILDIMLPEVDGFTIATRIREVNQQIPIIFLTAKSLLDDKIKGLTLGADDYITKPFSIEELVLKVEVFLKRSRINSDSEFDDGIYDIGIYKFNLHNQSLSYNGVVENMTLKEAELIHLFYQNKNKVLKREEILKAVWGHDELYFSRSLDVLISRLRKRLKEDKRINIKNIHGIGFNMMVSE
ncbi:response regulator transcription factor [Bacteroidota bacterium]